MQAVYCNSLFTLVSDATNALRGHQYNEILYQALQADFDKSCIIKKTLVALRSHLDNDPTDFFASSDNSHSLNEQASGVIEMQSLFPG